MCVLFMPPNNCSGASSLPPSPSSRSLPDPATSRPIPKRRTRICTVMCKRNQKYVQALASLPVISVSDDLKLPSKPCVYMPRKGLLRLACERTTEQDPPPFGLGFGFTPSVASGVPLFLLLLLLLLLSLVLPPPGCFPSPPPCCPWS